MRAIGRLIDCWLNNLSGARITAATVDLALINGRVLTLLFLEGSRTRHLAGWSQDKVSGEEQFHSLMAPQNAFDLAVVGGGISSAVGTDPGMRPVTSRFLKGRRGLAFTHRTARSQIGRVH
jgi:hypothetical protein